MEAKGKRLSRIHANQRVCTIYGNFYELNIEDIDCEYIPQAVQDPDYILKVVFFCMTTSSIS